MNSERKIVNISVRKDYSRFPAGRFRSDGPYSGEQFREEVLEPKLRAGDSVEIDLDGVPGYGSSFLDEAFGGLVRKGVLKPSEVNDRLRLKATDPSLVSEILEYMSVESNE